MPSEVVGHGVPAKHRFFFQTQGTETTLGVGEESYSSNPDTLRFPPPFLPPIPKDPPFFCSSLI